MKIGRDGERLEYRTVYVNPRTRRKVGQARVADHAKLERTLGETLYKAHCEIAEAISISNGDKNYPSQAGFIEKIPSTALNHEDYKSWQKILTDTLDSWYDSISYDVRMIARDISFQGLSIRATARKRRIGRKKTMEIYKAALNEWSNIRGYSDVSNQIPVCLLAVAPAG